MENLEKERSAHAAALAKRDEEYALKLEEQQSVPPSFFLTIRNGSVRYENASSLR